MAADVVQFVGHPDGPAKIVAELGQKVGTFLEAPAGKASLMWHVPLNMRGPFRPDQLANYDPLHEYRTDINGYALCLEQTQAQEPCKRKAVNRFPRCNAHGGRLHPHDKLIYDHEQDEKVATEELSRYQLFLNGDLSVDQLDDDELLGMGFRTAKGTIFKPKNIPRDMVTQFTRAIFDRSLDKLKVNALEAANTLSSIMLDDTVDANVRMRCATEILDRTIGKAPLNVSINPGAAWEGVFAGLFEGTREESRAARPDYIDVTPDDPLAITQAPTMVVKPDL